MKSPYMAAFLLGNLLMSCRVGWATEEASTEQDKVIQSLGVSGSARGSYWSSSMSLDGRNDLTGGALWLKAEPKLNGNASVIVEGWVRNDDTLHGGGSQGKLRESYLNLSIGDVDFRIGKQIIVWGRADKLNPTDNLTPRDYTLLVPEDDDQRIGAYAAKATYNFTDWSLTGIWLPEFRQNIVPLPHQAGVSFSENIPQGQGGGIKVEQAGKTIDWSLSYFDGIDMNADLSFGSVNGNGLNLQMDHHRIRVLGADAATVVGKYGLRAEVAYTRTEDADGTNTFVKNPFIYLVAGGDRTFFEYLNVNLQYYARQVSNYQSPEVEPNPQLRAVAIQEAVISNQFDRFQNGISLRISNKWMNETLEGEVAGITSFTRQEYVVRPKLVYSFSDLWKGTLGANLFRGDGNTFYGRLRDNSNIFTEIRYSF